MKKKNKKLPRYVLGTMNKYPLGYQPARGIGDSTFSVTPGQSLQPEISAQRRNLTSSIIGHVGTLGSLGYNIASNLGKSAAQTGASTTASAGSTAGSAGASGASGAASGGGSAAASAATNAAAVAAALYGAGGMVSDFINAGEHRTSADMALTGSRSNYTTAGGNTYTIYGNPNAADEYQYASQKHKQTTVDLMGHGAALGGGVGTLAGGPIWGIIGTAAGALVGGGLGLLGVGDNKEDVRKELIALGNANENRNKMNYSVAESKDIERAENGRIPVYSAMGKLKGKATARVSNGELIGNFEDGYVSRVPGKKNNKDSKLAALKDSDFVISNKYGLSDYAAQTGDYIGALNMQQSLLHNKYKNGKLPAYANGLDYIGPALSGVYAFLENNNQYNRAKKASTYAPYNFVEDSAGARAVNELANRRFDANPYLTDAERALKRENWNVRRQVGLGLGGRAVAQNSNFLNYLNSLANIRAKEQEANAGYTLQHAQALANYGRQKQLMMTNALNNQHQWQQQANAAKENWLAQYGQNRVKSVADVVRDIMDTRRYNQSLDIQNKMINLYDDQNKRENYRVFGDKEKQNTTGNALWTNPSLSDTLKWTNLGPSYDTIRWRNPGIIDTLKYINNIGL